MDTDIFISYRREDEPAFVGRVYELLRSTFPHHATFIDIDAIPPGDKFVGHIISRIAKCSVFLPVIGPQWVYRTGATSSRLFDDQDMVRKELESALVCKTTIIPVLVNTTPMPSPDSIPRTISALCALNAIRLTHASFHDDAKPLIRATKGLIKHHVEKHFTVAEFEVYQLGKLVGKDTCDRISRGVEASFNHLSKAMTERFFERAAPVIAARDGEGLQDLIDGFGREARRRESEIITGTIDYICEEMPHLGISPDEPNDPLFVAIEGQVQREFHELFLGMMEAIAVPLTKQIQDVGWRF